MSSPSPLPGLLPKIPIPPFSRLPVIAIYNYPISSGSLILPWWAQISGSGRIKIYVTVTEAGNFATVFAGDTWQPSYLNNGNALSANTMYEFTLDDITAIAINFVWYSSTSSVTSAYINLWVFFEPDVGEESD